ncbi:glycosyl transferase family 2 [Desulfovibrio sp. X2]|uniref:glycosyltransferase n=1 Tax=Desulfovibrio sp. X2 TaxID=941449 RepID=UPI000358903F|nr:glycosyltransferase [Desulfovibrio sp. X2]EPR37182.1 glycosyl transferase family 2 [Desulfovibrio sp. X2]
MHKVTVVVPTYNQAAYLPTCLDSVWFQDYPDVEIVVVDDASNDGTAEVLAQYAAAVSSERTSFASNYDEGTGTIERQWHLRYPPEGRSLVLLRHETNKGLSAALNTGFQAARGEYCTFIASDDILLPSMASELAAALDANAADFAYADMHVVDDNGRVMRRFSLPDYTFEDAFCRWYLCGICKLYKRELHERLGYYDLSCVSQDHEMFLRFAMGGARFVHVPKILANVRIHEKDRKVGNHSPEKESRQMGDSVKLVRLAREFAAGMSPRPWQSVGE